MKGLLGGYKQITNRKRALSTQLIASCTSSSFVARSSTPNLPILHKLTMVKLQSPEFLQWIAEQFFRKRGAVCGKLSKTYIFLSNTVI